MEKLYQPTCRMNIGGDAMVIFFRSQNEGKLQLAHFMQISCAYCVQAAIAIDKHLAWSCLADAYFYLGMANAAKTSHSQVEHLLNTVAKEALVTNARHSVSISVWPWQKTKDEAIRLILSLAETGDRWATYTEAARVIADDVETFLATLEPRKRFQGQKQRDTKIAKWLRDMPNASILFGSRSNER